MSVTSIPHITYTFSRNPPGSGDSACLFFVHKMMYGRCCDTALKTNTIKPTVERDLDDVVMTVT